MFYIKNLLLKFIYFRLIDIMGLVDLFAYLQF